MTHSLPHCPPTHPPQLVEVVDGHEDGAVEDPAQGLDLDGLLRRLPLRLAPGCGGWSEWGGGGGWWFRWTHTTDRPIDGTDL